MLKKAKQTLRSQRGQGMAEYGLLIALIAVVCIAALVILGPRIADKFTEVSNAIGGS